MRNGKPFGCPGIEYCSGLTQTVSSNRTRCESCTIPSKGWSVPTLIDDVWGTPAARGLGRSVLAATGARAGCYPNSVSVSGSWEVSGGGSSSTIVEPGSPSSVVVPVPVNGPVCGATREEIIVTDCYLRPSDRMTACNAPVCVSTWGSSCPTLCASVWHRDTPPSTVTVHPGPWMVSFLVDQPDVTVAAMRQFRCVNRMVKINEFRGDRLGSPGSARG